MTSATTRIKGLTEMAVTIREFPWETSTLGSVSTWDNNLIIYTNMILSCPFPMMIWWGKEKIQLYNDACTKLSKIRHHEKSKQSLGKPAEQCWPEAWDTIRKKLEILESDPLGVFEEDHMIPIFQGHQLEPVYWTFSYSHLQDEKGDNAGILVVFKETTRSNVELRNKKEKERFLLSLNDVLQGINDKKTIETESAFIIVNHFDFLETGFASLSADDGILKPSTKICKSSFSVISADQSEEEFIMSSLNPSNVIHDLSLNDYKIYTIGEYSVFISKIYQDSHCLNFIYNITKESFHWDNDNTSIITEASKRIGEFLTIAATQEKIIVSEARYRSLFDNILDAFMVIDFSFDASGKPVNYTFVSTNPAFEVQTGLTNVVGKTILEIMPEIEKEWMEGYGNVAITGEPAKFEQYNDATKRYYEVFASSIKDHPSQVVVVFRDITERKLDLESKKKFLNVASHELKTPLTSIYASIQLAQKMINAKRIDKASSLLEKSVTSLTKMTKIINGFLHLSSLEDPHEPMKKEVFDISELIENTYTEARSQHSTHQFIINSGSCKNVVADKYKIRLVLQNLITNAVQYSPQQSNITISCQSIEDKVNISVEDHGWGLDDLAIKNVSKKFFRVHDNPITGVSGLGLGLYICSKILQGHDSELNIESAPGKGSKFSFVLSTI